MNAMFFEYIGQIAPLTIRHSHLRVLIRIFIMYGLYAFQEVFLVESDSERLFRTCWQSSLHIIQVFIPDR